MGRLDELKYRARINNNICEHCKPIDNYRIAEMGICSLCGNVAECIDEGLLAFYKNRHINVSLIVNELPRLRARGITEPLKIDSISDIEKRFYHVIFINA